MIEVLHQFHDAPLWMRLAWLAVVGACVGSFVNVCIHRIPLGESILGRSRCDGCRTSIRWFDNIPVWSWFRLGGRCRGCGASFSVRHALVELLFGAAWAGLYWWEVESLGLYPSPLFAQPTLPTLYAQFALHAVLLAFLTAAALIDIDWFVIPDEVTLPGTLTALLLVTLFPFARLPDWLPGQPAAVLLGPLYWDLSLPETEIVPIPQPPPLAVAWGIACWWTYCLALLPWKFTLRRGWRIAWCLLARRLFQERYSLMLYGLGIVGTLLIAATAWWGGDAWSGMASSLVGIAGGILLLWPLRIVSGWAMGREALGFGDVTLAAMLGAFLGWQAVVILFFSSVFIGVALALFQMLVIRRAHLAFGPALCLGAVWTVVTWVDHWGPWGLLFRQLGSLLLYFYGGCLALMIPLLLVARRIREALDRDDEPENDPAPGDGPATGAGPATGDGPAPGNGPDPAPH